MRGFKGFDPDLKCRDFPYEVGQSYSHNGSVGLCQQGFHFCERLRDCFEFYDPDNGNRFCEVEAWENIQSDGHKSVAKNIEIIRELTPVEINRAKYGYGNGNGDGYGNGGLVKKEYKSEYTLDPIGEVCINKSKILFTIPCKW